MCYHSNMERYPINEHIEIYGEDPSGRPVIIVNEEDPLDKIYNDLKTRYSFTLIRIKDLNWLDDMSPWYCKALFKGDKDCGGNALDHLKKVEMLTSFIRKKFDPCSVFIAGYSLGGLFALYAAINSDLFDGVISASGSFWYPDFIDYARKRKISDKVRYIYFSIGDKEAAVRNKILRKVEENTRLLADHYRSKGIETAFVLNKGNHFQNSKERLNEGITWILERQKPA